MHTEGDDRRRQLLLPPRRTLLKERSDALLAIPHPKIPRHNPRGKSISIPRPHLPVPIKRPLPHDKRGRRRPRNLLGHPARKLIQSVLGRRDMRDQAAVVGLLGRQGLACQEHAEGVFGRGD